jgi:hypothetical protein
MSTTENLKNLFEELVKAYEDDDDEAKMSLAEIIKNFRKSFHINVEDDLHGLDPVIQYRRYV